jgi:hypothetical protein
MVNIKYMTTQQIRPLLEKYLIERGFDSIEIENETIPEHDGRRIYLKLSIQIISMQIPKKLSQTGRGIRFEIIGCYQAANRYKYVPDTFPTETREYHSGGGFVRRRDLETLDDLKDILDGILKPGQGIQHAARNSEQQKDNNNINNLLERIIGMLELIEKNTHPPPEWDKGRRRGVCA